MKTYDVILPIAGSIYMEIEADSEKEAIEKAFQTDWDIKIECNGEHHIDELEAYEKIVEGNVCYVSTTEAEALEQ